VAQSTVRLIVDAQNAIIPLQRVNKQTQVLNRNTDKLKGRLDRSSRSLKDTGRSAKVAAAGFGTLTKSIAPLLKALAVIGAARFVLFQTAQLETQTKALEVLTGSAETAQDIVQEIKEFGAVTPFKSSELIEVAKRMKAFGFETEDVVDITKRIADIAGTAGADIDGVALAIGKVQAKNKFMQEENIMLLEKGINVTKELEEITNMNGEQLAKAMSKGEIGADKFVEAIVRATSKNGQFFEGASKQSDTLAGKFSTFIDNVETFAQNLGKLFEGPTKFILDQLNAIASEFNKIFSLLTDAQIGASNQRVFSASFKARFGMQAEAVDEITKAVELLDPTFVKTEQDAAKLFAQIERISKVIKLVRGPDSLKVLDERGLLEPLLEAINQLDTIREKVNENLNTQKNLTSETENTNNKLNDTNNKIKKIKDSTDGVSDAFKQIGESIAQGVSTALTDAILQARTLGEAAKGILNMIARQFLQLGINTLLFNVFGGSTGLFKNLPTFANGGKPPVGRPSIVGERGPELFVPSSAGTIIPNHSLGGGVTNNIVVNVDASGSNVEGDERQSRELGLVISNAIQAQLIQEKRPGGLLA